jgi:hypothetical protein
MGRVFPRPSRAGRSRRREHRRSALLCRSKRCSPPRPRRRSWSTAHRDVSGDRHRDAARAGTRLARSTSRRRCPRRSGPGRAWPCRPPTRVPFRWPMALVPGSARSASWTPGSGRAGHRGQRPRAHQGRRRGEVPGRRQLSRGRRVPAVLNHHGGLSGVVPRGSPSFRVPVDLRRRTSANLREPAADAWGSRGRRSTRALSGACDDAVLHDSSPKARRSVRSGEPGLDWQVGLAAVVPADWGLSRFDQGIRMPPRASVRSD